MKKISLFIILSSFLIPMLVFAQSGRKQVLEGNKLYEEQKFDEANNKYRDALVNNPENPIINFNIGNTEFQKKKYEEALKNFEKSLSVDDYLMQSKSYYNMGNTLYRMGKLPESILAYTQALKLNPRDEDSKFNLEFVRAKLKDQAQKDQQQQQQDQEKIEPSENAKRLKAKADELVLQREYQKAHKLMENGKKSDKTVGAFQGFIDRIKEIIDIEVAS